jgi:exosome complex component RRP45
MSSTSYITIRDDGGGLSVNERDFLRQCALRGTTEENDSQKTLRLDGRGPNDVRNIQTRLHRWDNGAEATIQWGRGTRVSAICRAELVPPSLDRPNEGIIGIEVDLSPMAGFRLAPAVSTGGKSSTANFSNQEQRLLSNRILRCLERILIMGGALDTEALVLEGGKWVWKLTLAVTALDAGGNLLDASVLAAVAALRHYRKPQVDMTALATTAANQDDPLPASAADHITLPTLIPSTVKEATPLPLHHSPLSISFGLIPADDAVHSTSSTSIVAALLDPTDREELVQSGSLTIAMNIHSEICLLDYGGGCELTPQQLKECCRGAQTATQGLCQLLETTLEKADEQAQAERLRLLQLQQQAFGDATMLPPLPNSSNNIPFMQQLDDQLEIVDAPVDDRQVDQVQAAAEEAYRQQALDYASGHVATSVREDSDKKQQPSALASSLLAAMLKSVEQQPIKPQPPNQLSESVVTKDDAASATTSIIEDAKPAEKPKCTPDAMDQDDDEDEEETTMLQSEFDAIQPKQQIGEAPATQPPAMQPPAATEEEDDIEDLSMAIKSSKKKKSKKKK